MKVFFVSSGNSINGISPIVYNQGESLKSYGQIDVSYFRIKGKGVLGYLKNSVKIRKAIRSGDYDIIHAHYSLSAFAAMISFTRIPLVVSLMGSDVKLGGWQKWLIKSFANHYWTASIVKSEEMAKLVGEQYCTVIPNGVDLDLFRVLPKRECRVQLKLDLNKTYILFAANPSRYEKNFALVQNAFHKIDIPNAELIYLQDIPHNEISIWMNAADAACLSSLWEGSPNVIKEAMACNRPIVSTNVGNVEWLFGHEPGHFIAGFEDDDYAYNLKLALDFSNKNGSTNGRERIKKLGLDSQTIAKRIISIYKEVLNEV